MSVVPHRFLFRYSFPVRHVAKIPRKGQTLLNLPSNSLLTDPAELDGSIRFADLYLAWNDAGMGFSAVVKGKTKPLVCRSETPAESDGIQIWIDTRNTQSIHRASRFCHHFCVLPTGGGKKLDRPMAVQVPIARARDDSALAKPEQFSVSVKHHDDGYRLEVWLPAEMLHGYDPKANPHLGFYYTIRDAELGEQCLTVGREFPFAHDPSLWSTLELQAD